MPSDIENLNPKGDPKAKTRSPCIAASPEARRTGTKAFSPLTCSTAMSVNGSMPVRDARATRPS